MKWIKKLFEKKPKQACFNCPTCGKHYRAKHLKEDTKISFFCWCGTYLKTFVVNNEISRVTYID